MITVYLKNEDSQVVIYEGDNPEEKGIIITEPLKMPIEFELEHNTEIIKVKQTNFRIGFPKENKEVVLERV